MDTTTLPISTRIRDLRKEKGLKQSELAERVNIDVKMISYYETGKSIPSVDVLIQIARVFDVSIDYLLLENVPRRPLNIEGDLELIQELTELDKLTDEDKTSVKHIIKSLIAKNKVKDLVS